MANNPLLTGASVLFAGNQFRIVAGRGGTFNPDSIIQVAADAATTMAKDVMLDLTSSSVPDFNVCHRVRTVYR